MHFSARPHVLSLTVHNSQSIPFVSDHPLLKEFFKETCKLDFQCLTAKIDFSEWGFYVVIAYADIGSLKSLHTLFDENLVKFEQMVWSKPYKILCFLKWTTFFDKVLTPFKKTFLWLTQLFDARILIQRLPFFMVPKITALRYV